MSCGLLWMSSSIFFGWLFKLLEPFGTFSTKLRRLIFATVIIIIFNFLFFGPSSGDMKATSGCRKRQRRVQKVLLLHSLWPSVEMWLSQDEVPFHICATNSCAVFFLFFFPNASSSFIFIAANWNKEVCWWNSKNKPWVQLQGLRYTHKAWSIHLVHI